MQTFLPYASASRSASVLDRQRLGKQRVEAWQILSALRDPTYGWQNHPAVRMWQGHESALAVYGMIVCSEWRNRGYKDTLFERFYGVACGPYVAPFWLGDEAFHLSHRSNLVRKLPAHYGPLFPGVPNDLPYVWPVNARG